MVGMKGVWTAERTAVSTVARKGMWTVERMVGKKVVWTVGIKDGWMVGMMGVEKVVDLALMSADE